MLKVRRIDLGVVAGDRGFICGALKIRKRSIDDSEENQLSIDEIDCSISQSINYQLSVDDVCYDASAKYVLGNQASFCIEF